MGRAALAVGDQDGLPCLSGGVDLVFVKGELVFLEPGQEERVHTLTMLLNLSDDPTHRQVFNCVGFTVAGLRIERETLSGSGWEQALLELVRDCPPGRVNVVVVLPRFDPLMSIRTRRALEAIKDGSPHTFGVVVAVAENTAAWRALSDVDGFVRATKQSLAYDATALFGLLATFMAPTLLTCSSDSDVIDALGDATHPSNIVVATWNTEEKTLQLYTCCDRHAIVTAAAVNLSPLWADGTWRASHELMRQLRQLLPGSSSCIYNVSTDFFRPTHSVGGARFAPVVILCKPDLELQYQLSEAAPTRLSPAAASARKVGIPWTSPMGLTCPG